VSAEQEERLQQILRCVSVLFAYGYATNDADKQEVWVQFKVFIASCMITTTGRITPSFLSFLQSLELPPDGVYIHTQMIKEITIV
jgi:hypothetical protein